MSIPPILLLTWKRPETTQKVIEALRKVEPNCIYIASDGPIEGDLLNEQQVEQTRQLIKTSIDWPCKKSFLFRNENKGCKHGVAEAISWFFDSVEQGIILEDDCIPHPDFFLHCSKLLDRYKDDSRVWCISGNNFQDGQWRGDGSYYFGKIPLIWGWATWKRCWKYYDVNISKWPDFRKSGLMHSTFSDPLELDYWKNIWDYMHSDRQANTWDYQWTFTCISNGGLTAVPNVNLVSNIGFGPEATHTKEKKPAAETESLKGYKHPTFIIRDAEADQYIFDHHFDGIGMRKRKKVSYRAISKLKRVLNRALQAPALLTRPPKAISDDAQNKQ